MVAAVRNGESQRSVARRFGVSPSTVNEWVERSQGIPLDAVNWSDQPHVAHVIANRTDSDTEQQILALRTELKEKSDLGEYGAEAILREMTERGHLNPPCARTINRILERHGAFDGKRRQRQKAPPPGWYLPSVAGGMAELDQFDVVTGLVIEGGIDVEVLNAISLHGGLIASWPDSTISARFATQALITHWRNYGCPTYAQFDNDTRFQGAHQYQDCISRVMRLCLSLQVVPVFAPVQEMGFQAAIESLNNRWQQKVWERFHHESLYALKLQSDRYVAAVHRRSAQRQERAPARSLIPENWELNLQVHPQGQVIFLRRTNERGQANLLGHTFKIDEHWLHRLIRAEVSLPNGPIRFYALRRQDPAYQPLLNEHPYSLPRRRFNE